MGWDCIYGMDYNSVSNRLGYLGVCVNRIKFLAGDCKLQSEAHTRASVDDPKY
jgi:hypothetical protein